MPRFASVANVNSYTRRAGGIETSTLFADGSQGAWYDPSDFSTLFQNSAGTTPVTAVEQPVRLMLDRSGRGNNATAPNDASRPVLRSRYNLLTFSEQFDNAAWTASDAVITANAAVAPDGTTTADQIAFSTTSGFLIQQFDTTITAVTYTFSVYLRAASATTVVVSIQQSGGATSNSTASVTTDWQRFSVTYTTTGSPTFIRGRILPNSNTPTVFAWGAQLLTAADQTATGGAYQRIAAATSYDTSNPVWRPYLAFDGTDDSFSTSSIDFSATDEMTVFAGVTKLSDAAQGIVAELSTIFTSNNGSFNFSAPGDAGTGRYSSGLRGTSTGFGGVETFSAPITNVVTQQLDIGQSTIATEIVMRVNGTQQTLINTSSPTTAGTGNFGNYALFIGRRNNTSNPLNGRIYSLIVLGRAATTAELTSTETWVNGKTGAF